jgi:photosystem II stability/assembly factor-like uncharacterized protein
MKIIEMLSRYVVLIGLVLGLTGPGPQQSVQPKTLPYKKYGPLFIKPFGFTATGPEGGEIASFVINPQNPQEMYAGSWGGGVFKSTDGGANWQRSSSGLIDGYIQSLAMDPKTPTTIYAGMYGYGVYKTTDGGDTWQATGPGLNSNPVVYDLQVDPQNPNNIYAGTRSQTAVFAPPWGGGAYKSTNGGSTWTAINNGLAEDWVYSLAIDPSTPSTVYAALHTQGISKTTDGGKTWKTINSGLDDTAGRAVVIDPLHPQTVYFGTWHGGSVFRSTNGGSSWQAARSGLSGAKIYKLIIDPINPAILYAANARGMAKTTNSAGSWSGIGYSNDFIPTMAVDPKTSGVVFTGVMGVGLLRSSNGGTNWSFSQHGLYAGIVHSMLQTSSMLYVGLGGNGIARSSDGGKTWLSEGNGVGDFWVQTIAITPSNPQIMYAGTDRAGVFKSTNGGASWGTINSGLATATTILALNPKPSLPFPPDLMQTIEGEDPSATGAISPKSVQADLTFQVLALAVDPHNASVVLLGTDASGVFKSTNSGGSWSATSLSGKMINALIADPANINYFYAATTGASGGLWKTKDGASTWNTRNSGISGLDVFALLIDPGNANHLYVGTSDGVFQSVDGGLNWTRYGLAGQHVYSLAFSPGGMSVGTISGLYISKDGGASWLGRETGAPNLGVYALLLNKLDGNTLILGSLGQGVLLDNSEFH